MIKVAKCLSDDYIHSYRLKNFCYEHKMPVSEIKSDLLSQVVAYAGDDESTKTYKETYEYSGSVVKTKIQAFYNEPISVAELGRCPR